MPKISGGGCYRRPPDKGQRPVNFEREDKAYGPLHQFNVLPLTRMDTNISAFGQ